MALDKPKIMWLINDYDSYVPYNNYTMEGTYTYNDIITKRIKIYNNYKGTEAVADAKNAKLILAFKNYEDNFLLNLLKVKRIGKDADYVYPEIDIDRGIVELGTIYGDLSNDYIEIELVIGPLPSNLRSELKSLVLYINYDFDYVDANEYENINNEDVDTSSNASYVDDSDVMDIINKIFKE